ncbi:MAG: ferrous iron transport protein B [Planctomycetota bacterium]|nr:ferrous iron transport protein B [Planctomycetota bacterium]
MTSQSVPTLPAKVALIGNPNTGKTTLFNALTGLSQKTGNYPGVTVDKKVGSMDQNIELIDLPGTYSLAGRSPDEVISIQVLLGQIAEQKPDLIVVVTDACQFKRSCFLVTQLMELEQPLLVAVNMMDLAEKAKVQIDVDGLKKVLGVEVVPVIAKQSSSLDSLKDCVKDALKKKVPAKVHWTWPEAFEKEGVKLAKALSIPLPLARRALIDEGLPTEQLIATQCGDKAIEQTRAARETIKAAGLSPARVEAELRHNWIETNIGPVITQGERGPSFTDKVDGILLHKFFGTVIFFSLMTFVFMAIFDWAGPLMDLIDGGVGSLGELAGSGLQAAGLGGGPLESLVCQGIIAGVGGVLVFLPQILLLFLFLAILEDCGYMARAAFLMDRLLRFAGLSGHAFVPLMSSFACAVPGLMATRTISNRSERFATIFVAPLMSCSARIPVYTLMIAAFVPGDKVFGLFSLQALVFTAMYLIGIVVAIPISLAVKKFSGFSTESSFLMELPTYKTPSAKTVFLRVYQAGKAFLTRAGTVIFVASVIIWALSYFPRSQEIHDSHEVMRTEVQAKKSGEELETALKKIDSLEQGTYLRESYLGQLGQFIEPAVKPAGWDWSVGIAVLASFPAREVVISVFGIVYDLGEDLDTEEDDDSKALTNKLKAAKWPDGRPVFNLPVALSILVFFALCMQCAATVATVKQETNSWSWAMLSFFGLTFVAYIAAILSYQIGMAVGLGDLVQ